MQTHLFFLSPDPVIATPHASPTAACVLAAAVLSHSTFYALLHGLLLLLLHVAV